MLIHCKPKTPSASQSPITQFNLSSNETLKVKCWNSWDDEIKCGWLRDEHSRTNFTNMIQLDSCVLECRFPAAASLSENSDRIS